MTDNAFLDARGRTRVVVTGMGVKTPAGTDLDTMWSTVTAGRGTAGRIERWDPSELPVQFACEVKNFDATPYFGPKDVRRQDRVTQLGFAAAADALADAGDVGADPSRCAVIAATGVGGLETMEINEATFIERGASRVSPFFVTMMMPNATAARSRHFGWRGPTSASPPRAQRGMAIGEGVRLCATAPPMVAAGGTEARSRRSPSRHSSG
jgi:3-oxoacyl-[acyl-carrier-protein] synthase II